MSTRLTAITALVLVVAGAVASWLATMRGTFDEFNLGDAEIAWLLIGVVVGAWLLAAMGPRFTYRRSDLVMLVAMGAAFALLFGWSQLRPGVIAPPIEEWGIACGLVGIGFVVVALMRRHSPDAWSTGHQPMAL